MCEELSAFYSVHSSLGDMGDMGDIGDTGDMGDMGDVGDIGDEAYVMLHLNVRSLPKKIDQIRLMLHDSNLDVLTFSETWLKSHLHTKTVELRGYKPFRLDRNKRGPNTRTKKRDGGLITFIHEKHVSNP